MSKDKGKTKVSVYPDWCKGCGICVAFCPAKVLEMGPDGKARVARESDCLNCGFCELHCPDFAIDIRLVDEKPPVRPLDARNLTGAPDNEVE